MTPKARIKAIHDQIEQDRRRMEQGSDPELTLQQITQLLNEAAQLAQQAAAGGIQLDESEQARAAAVLPLWTAQLARMDRTAQMREVHARRTDQDRIGLHLIGTLTTHADVRALARQPMDNARAELFTTRQAFAAWRALAQQTPAQRAQRAEWHAQQAERGNGPPPPPSPDKISTYGADYALGGL